METSMINVQKRDTSVEPLNLDKVHTMVEEACKDLSGVSASQVEMNSGIQFEDGITTEQIQEILIRSASDLITLDNPNYQFVAARLLLFGLRKQVFNKNMKVLRLEHFEIYTLRFFWKSILKTFIQWLQNTSIEIH